MSRLYVCRECIEDPDLQEVVWQHRVSNECDYCGTVSDVPIACELGDILQRMMFVIRQYYASPANLYGLQYLDQYDVLNKVGFEVKNGQLMDDVLVHFASEEIVDEKGWDGDDHERFMHGWERFKWIVTHLRRYTFSSIKNDDSVYDEFPPNTVLSSIAGTMRHIDLTVVVEKGIKIWRVREDNGSEKLDREDDFTAPPIEFAKYPNRMSPSGVPMFYGADDFETAVKETIAENQRAVGICFETLIPLNLLDLTAIPEVRMFSEMPRDDRQAIMFLKGFRKDVSRPVARDLTVQHIEYVPTQVFTEYIRFEAKTDKGEPYHGIRYPSSITGEPCYVLFVDEYACKASTLPTRQSPLVLRSLMETRREAALIWSQVISRPPSK